MKYKIIILTKKIFHFLGIDPRKIISIRHLPRFINDYLLWKKKNGNITSFYPILSDKDDAAGVASGHYFHQDLLVAQYVISSGRDHVDIGSRIDGFIAHIASSRPVEVWDIRSLKKSVHPNIVFKKRDLTSHLKDLEETISSLSCLHALEHFGLGRYGDPINTRGHIIALENMIRLLKPLGNFYIGIPLDKNNTIQFNAHRTFHPNWILNLKVVRNNLDLQRFDYVDGSGELFKNIKCSSDLPNLRYSCGIYTFSKKNILESNKKVASSL